jgi:hypothetical protein
MKNVIYTSYGFGTGQGGHGHFENKEWSKIQRKKINEYANRHNICLKVIDTNNKYMAKILSTIEPNRDINSKNHSVYTLSAIAAILDFCDSDDDLFYWLHLDMAINRMDVNVFDTFDISDDDLYCWAWEDFKLEHQWDSAKFKMLKEICRSNGLDVPEERLNKKCNASVLILTKQCGLKFRDTILNQINFFENPPSPRIGFIEETVVEAVEAVTDINVKGEYYLRKKQPTLPINFVSHLGYDKNQEYNSVFVHFYTDNKRYIPEFYKDRGEL